MFGLIFFRSIWASCMMVQSKHPWGEAMISNSNWVSLPSDLHLLVAGVLFVTFFTNSMSSVEIEHLEVRTCLFLAVPFLQVGQSHVVLLLFGMRLRLRHAKWKNLPFWQHELWHWTSLSVFFTFCLHKQIKSKFRTSSGVMFSFAVLSPL